MKWDPAKYVQFGDYRDRPFFDLTGRIHADSPAAGGGPRLRPRQPHGDARGPLAGGAGGGPGFVAGNAGQADAPRRPSTANLSFEPGRHRRLAALRETRTSWSPTPPCSGCPATVRCWPAGSTPSSPGAWFALQVPGQLQRPVPHPDARAGRIAGLGGPARRGAAPRRRRWGRPPNTWRSCSTPAAPPTPGRPPTSSCCPGENPVLEWVRGTGLRPVLAALSADEAHGVRGRIFAPGWPRPTRPGRTERCSRSAGSSRWPASGTEHAGR